ncbi:3'-phosphoadenosine 5'-phosphosulfate sulfotransferase (PAPS reductase)/FAD synthetase [Paraburkholderia sp. GAS448]|uniref:phosphoadenosine phosphosulfate reductase domain-containing protein n=1 Tax=Paraburkholderia sp. GAS448 TaxID=3035136 RepID=UPI003D246CF0
MNSKKSLQGMASILEPLNCQPPQQQSLFEADLSDVTGPWIAFDPYAYDKYVVMFSGGKDSAATVLHLLDIGIDPSRIELWHHDVDGNGESFMDWPVTSDYCRRFAAAFGLPLYFSWRVGGFLREMLRENQSTAPVVTETPDGLIQAGGVGPQNTRRKFPQVTAALSQRWCSASLKVDVGAAAMRNQPRFLGIRSLVCTGERAQESAARSKYLANEPDRCHTQSRHVDHWRPVLQWSEEQVWDIMKRFGVRPHPAYYLGFNRVSCAHCIFSDCHQRATERKLMPMRLVRIADLEREFGLTIHRRKSVHQLADEGTPYVYDEAIAALALSTEYTVPIRIAPAEWALPSGAFKQGAGPQ